MSEDSGPERGLEQLERWWGGAGDRPRHPFATPLWLRTWWECFGNGGPLRVATVPDGSARPLALLPVCADRERAYGIPLARVGAPWNPHTPRIGLLLEDGREPACEALWRRLRDGEGRWDVLRLCQIPPEDAAAAHRIVRLASADGFLVGRWTSEASPYVPMRGSFEEYQAGLSSKFRSNLRRRRRLLEELGEVGLETVDGAHGREHLDRALADAFRLEGAAWKERAGTAIGSHPNETGFYRLLAHRAAESGWLRLRFLTVAGHRVAVNYSLLYGNKLYFLKGGYHPDVARCSPSNLLLHLILRDAHEQRLAEVDLLGGAEPWKRPWTSHQRPHEWIFIYRPSVRTRLVHRLKFGVAPRLRAALGERSGAPSLACSTAAP